MTDMKVKTFLMLYYHDSMLKSHIAKVLRTSIQVVNYHLEDMMDEGLVVEFNGKYQVNPIFHSDDAEMVIHPLLKVINEAIVRQLPDGIDKERVLVDMLHMFVEIQVRPRVK